ncbi:DNA repair protein XRCC3 homolog [Spinacia oleracea]|uniref:DNA repair protein XRCC3 homolog n=1 Tax=Spinacia oleracea TaxID=3562 RepID=A0ABM3RQD1_SPIOL|nr:DNA repair protein XRCC3 homolog [Spinacia oleracea]XP_056695715.1 DNA repair protein XRCC3 homolog [Spinacia oleracea]XP_056697658.1 DNA repair protein XRCC3 homolog [Spinacia oleracea]XP_056697819.1 DNA repair protein XRCC3 homolog [Spinacia oleracea]
MSKAVSNEKTIVQKIATRCNAIDRIMQGGVSVGEVTELCGENATGKTQLCLQTSIACQLPPSLGGMFGASIYIHSIGPFPIRRLTGIMPHILQSPINQIDNPCDHITTKQVESPHELPDVLDWVVKLIKYSHNTCRHIRLVVIDSIASICASHFENTVEGLDSRTQLLRAIGYGLHSIASTYNVAVIVVNNVVDVFPSDRDSSTNFMMSSGRKVRPALGKGWTRNIATRLFLSKALNPVTQTSDRLCSVLLSPTLELDACRFKITEKGVRDE